jgi:CRP/FNR family transcriptional regulator
MRQSTIQIFDSLKITHSYPKGTTLFMEGHPSEGIYLLCQGKVKLSTCSKDGKVIILHIAKPGELLGLSSTVTDSIHIATAEVIEPCQVNFVRNDDFLNFLRQHSDACLSAVRQLGKNYNTAYLQICSLGLASSVSDKLAMLFLGWCKAAVEYSDGIHLKMSYTHEEIAEMIGTSRETVTRMLKEFRKQHLITMKGSEMIIPDKKKLEGLIGSKARSRL